MHHIICHVNQVKTSSFFSHDTAVHVGTDPIVGPLFTVPPFKMHLYWLGLLLPPPPKKRLYLLSIDCAFWSPKRQVKWRFDSIRCTFIMYTAYKTEHLKCIDRWNMSKEVDKLMKAAHTEIDDQVGTSWTSHQEILLIGSISSITTHKKCLFNLKSILKVRVQPRENWEISDNLVLSGSTSHPWPKYIYPYSWTRL